MKLIIDIPDHLYDIIKNKECTDKNVLTKAVEKGISLPKGHRFIDADEILNHAFIEESEEGDIFAKKYYCIRKEIMDNALVLFDTLEADPAESEEK